MSVAGSIRFLIAEELPVSLQRWDFNDPISHPSFEVKHDDDNERHRKDILQTGKSPILITNIRQIGPTSLLLKWNNTNLDNTDGYEITVNGQIKSKVFSANRTSTVVDSINRRSVYISIYAMHNRERCTPPAIARCTLT